MNRTCFFFFLFLIIWQGSAQTPRQTILFTNNWKFYKGDVPNGESVELDDSKWQSVDLPHDWSIEGPFSQQWASGTGFLPGGIINQTSENFITAGCLLTFNPPASREV